MKTLLAATTALALCAAAGAAHAQSSGNWTGLYVGAQAGYGWAKNHNSETVVFDTNLDRSFNNQVNTAAGANAFSPGFCGGYAKGVAPVAGCGKDHDGFEFGGRVGYDYQIGNFVVGVVGEATRTSQTDSVSAFSTTPAAYNFTRKLHAVGAVRLRAGYALGDTLVYGAGGYAVADVKRTFATTNTANTFGLRGGNNPDGYQLGGGIEQKVAPNVTLGIEYLYTRLSDNGYTVRAQGPAAATNAFLLVNGSGTDLQRSRDKFSNQAVRMTAAYRF